MALSEMGHMPLAYLPDVALGKILSYLHWKEKDWLAVAVPSITRILHSPMAWSHFENDRAYAVEKLYMYIYFPVLVHHEVEMIQNFGQYFQSSTIWLYKIVTQEEREDDDLLLLTSISRYCKQLRSLCIMHPGDLSVKRIKAVHSRYLQPIKEMAQRKPDSFRLIVGRLFYSSIDTLETGIEKYLQYLQENDLASYIVSLDFSHGLVYADHVKAVYELKQCRKLKTLKCPVQAVNTTVIAELCRNSLTDLYLVNDDHTSHINFSEKLHINWNKVKQAVYSEERNHLRVHYIYKNRTLSHELLIPNPFVSSVVLDNLSSDLPAILLHHLADLYGPSVRTLAFCSQYWEFLMHYSDLGQIDNSFRYLGTKCVRLKSFLSCLSIPSSALVCLARHSPSLATIKVFRENVRLAIADQPEAVFTQKVAQALHARDWKMIKKGSNIYSLPGVDAKLLFANCFIEI